MTDADQKYDSYDQVPFYRRQWFFWLMYLIICPVAIIILLSGDVYYQKGEEIRSFGLLNRIVAGVIAVGILASAYTQFFK